MKKLLLLIAIAGGIYTYNLHSANPLTIDDPTYVEARVLFDVPNSHRELEYVLVGEMTSPKDCAKRSQRFVDRLFEECAQCEIKTLQCRDDIADRHKKLFYGHTTHTTYLALRKGNRYERDARMLVWGLNQREADKACEIMKDTVESKYEGEVSCVVGRLS